VNKALLPAFAALVTPLYRAYFATLRVQGRLADGSTVEPGRYPFGAEIFALCERDALALAGIMAHARFTVLVTLGRDGDWASGILAKLGCGVIRGSSLRDGARALTQLIRTMREGDAPGAIVVDGPLGPPGEAKSGILLCAQRTGRPIRALGVAARHQFVFRRTWSQLYLPLPFTRVVVACEDPLSVPASGDRELLAQLTRELNTRLAVARQRARAELIQAGAANALADATSACQPPHTSADTCAEAPTTLASPLRSALEDRR
jgi:lysophospholipid acyltransferase (LPLAT)-like uncharacterized protein